MNHRNEINDRNEMKYHQSRQIKRHGTRFDIGHDNLKFDIILSILFVPVAKFYKREKKLH